MKEYQVRYTDKETGGEYITLRHAESGLMAWELVRKGNINKRLISVTVV